jgi:16S rRNA G966 N2-methylase RsmD
MEDIREYIAALMQAPVQDFIRLNAHADTASITLKQKKIAGVPVVWIAEQIKAQKKIRKKLPLWYNTTGVVYPPTVNLEQSSSEITAKYKRDVIKNLRINKLADLSAGFGVDSFFLAQACHELHHVEPNENLIALAQHNHELLSAENIHYYKQQAEDFIKHSDELDLIYLDPSRRSASGKKIFLLQDCEPDILRLQDELLKQAKHVLIKTSPMLDIQAGIKALHHVKEVYILSTDNECKEVLFLLEANYAGSIKIHAAILSAEEAYTFSYAVEETSAITFSEALNYLYEPDAAIIKSGMSNHVANKNRLHKLHPNTLLYTSDVLINNFPGRVFEVLGPVKLSRDNLKNYFPDYAASISTRNYPASAEELRKKTKLKEDERFFLWAFTDSRGKQLCATVRMY